MGFVVVCHDSLDGHPRGAVIELADEAIPRLVELGAAQVCDAPKPEPVAKSEPPKTVNKPKTDPPPAETEIK